MNLLDINAQVPLPLVAIFALVTLGVYLAGRGRRVVVSVSPERRAAIVAARREHERSRQALVQAAAAAPASIANGLGNEERRDIAALVRGLREGVVDDSLRSRVRARRERQAGAGDDQELRAAA